MDRKSPFCHPFTVKMAVLLSGQAQWDTINRISGVESLGVLLDEGVKSYKDT